MPNTTVPAAATGLPVVIPFPIDRVRPSPSPAPISDDVWNEDAWKRCLTTAWVLKQFDEGGPSHLADLVAELVTESPDGFAYLIRSNGEAIAFLQKALAHFTSLDAMIGASAARFLNEVPA